METLAALSLACNVLQLIQFSSHTIHVCKQFYDDQSPSDDVDDHCRDLQALSSRVKASLATFGGARPSGFKAASSGSDQQLLSLANKLIKIADDLNTELAKFRPDSRDSKRRKVVKGVKYQWGGKNRVDELHSSLKALENTIQSFVLIDLRETTSNIHEKDFEILDQQTRDIAFSLAAGFVRTDEDIRIESGRTRILIKDQCNTIKSGLDSQFEKTRAEITSESQKLQDLIKHELTRLQNTQLQSLKRERVQRLLKSLEVPDINARYHAIAPSHDSTFEWIYAGIEPADQDSEFATPDDDLTTSSRGTHAGMQPIDQDSEPESLDDDLREHSLAFSRWLNSKESLFWISGKPGSGKSTLMKFLLEHSRTRDLLREQQGSTLILSHFIWNAGSYVQRSLKSLIALLLHQLLSRRADVAHTLLERDALQQKSAYSDWSQESLDACLFEAIHCMRSPVCIFIDGLDEIDQEEGDGLYDLLRLIGRFRSLSNVRICVSSRPEAYIRQEYETDQSVRLQDLTRPDIRKYILDKLTPEWEKTAFLRNSDKAMSSITETILDKSDGIFLWVRLVVSSIRNGLVKYDSWEMLLKRIETLPSKMSELYKSMWNRLNEDKEVYRDNSALYFKLLLFRGRSERSLEVRADTVLRMLVASDCSIQLLLFGGRDDISELDLTRKCHVFQHQLLSRCAGLVEVEGQPEETRSIHAKIRFIHKSAADFLLYTLDGQILLQHDNTTIPELFVRSLLSALVSEVLLGNFMTNLSLAMDVYKLMTNCDWLRFYEWRRWQERSTSLNHCYQLTLDLVRRTLNRIPEWISWKLDFVCVAAELRLWEYVLTQVRERSPPQDLSLCAWKSLLLGFSCQIFLPGLFYFRLHLWKGKHDFQIIQWLLDQGADPNRSIGHIRLIGTTPFKCFLLTLADKMNHKLNEIDKMDEMDETEKTEFMRVFYRFIDHGADMNDPLLMLHTFPEGCSIDRTRFPILPENRAQEGEDEESEDEEIERKASKNEGSKDNELADFGQSWIHNIPRPENESRSEKYDSIVDTEGRPKSRCTLILLVEIQGAGSRMFKALSALLGQDEKSREVLDASATSLPRVRLIMRISESCGGGPLSPPKTDNVWAKIVASEEMSEELRSKGIGRNSQRHLKHAYHNHISPEMSARETLVWMIENGFLAEEMRSCENPLFAFSFQSCRATLHEALPKREGLSGVDFSFHGEYSKLMETMSQISKEEDAERDFVDYCTRNPQPRTVW